MNFTSVKKYFNQCDQRFQLMTLHQGGILCVILVLSFWGNSQPASASLLHYQSSSIISFQPTLVSQASLPTSVETAIRQDLSSRTDLKGDKFTLKQSSPQTWSDGCLGLGSKDELCTQALVNGWRVVMEYQDQTWVYRSDDTGLTVRLED